MILDWDAIATERRRAQTGLDEAELMYRNGFYEGGASRAYYAAFHAARVLLLAKGYEPRKHSGAISLINQHYVKTGLLDREHARYLTRLFELRSVADYSLRHDVTEHECREAVDRAGDFVRAVEHLFSTDKWRE